LAKVKEKKISTAIEGLALSSKKRCNLKKPIIAQNIVLVGNLASHLNEINKSKTLKKEITTLKFQEKYHRETKTKTPEKVKRKLNDPNVLKKFYKGEKLVK